MNKIEHLEQGHVNAAVNQKLNNQREWTPTTIHEHEHLKP